jgi:hypothetical protein
MIQHQLVVRVSLSESRMDGVREVQLAIFKEFAMIKVSRQGVAKLSEFLINCVMIKANHQEIAT